MNFEQKYLKYKEKYLELKKQSGGVRVLSQGPMIGYPAAAMPMMGPSYSIRGPVVGPGPFGHMLAPMPGPFFAGPRLVRVTEETEHKCNTCPTCATCAACVVPQIHRINLIIRQAILAAALGVPIAEDFTVELLNTTDNAYYNAVMGRLRNAADAEVTAIIAAGFGNPGGAINANPPAPGAAVAPRIVITLINNPPLANSIIVEILIATINAGLVVPRAPPIQKTIQLTNVQHGAVVGGAPAGAVVLVPPVPLPANQIRSLLVNCEFV